MQDSRSTMLNDHTQVWWSRNQAISDARGRVIHPSLLTSTHKTTPHPKPHGRTAHGKPEREEEEDLCSIWASPPPTDPSVCR